MNYVIFNKATKYIVSAGIDMSVPQVYGLDARFSDFMTSNNLLAEQHAAVTLSEFTLGVPTLGRDMFDETTNTIYQDPSYVAPALTPPQETLE